MKEIALGGGKVALVDDCDFEFLNRVKWKPLKTKTGNYYAVHTYTSSAGVRTILAMHKLVAQPRYGFLVDHINGNGLDNRRENLRLATRIQNAHNRRPNRRSKSGFKGVSLAGRNWRAQIVAHGQRHDLGSFGNTYAAARAYNAAAQKYHGEFAWLNPLPQDLFAGLALDMIAQGRGVYTALSAKSRRPGWPFRRAGRSARSS